MVDRPDQSTHQTDVDLEEDKSSPIRLTAEGAQQYMAKLRKSWATLKTVF